MEKIVAVAALVGFLVAVVAGFPSQGHSGVPAGASLECVPGQAFVHDDGCNSCFCPKSGIRKDAGCTRMSCLPVTVAVRKERSVDTGAAGESCVPGSSFPHSDNCNTCSCPDSGIKAHAPCTLMACVNLTTTHHHAAAGESCVPGSSFPHRDNCNTCTCPPSGIKARAMCTLMACVNLTTGHVHHSSESSESSEHRTTRDTSATCEPGTSFMDSENCNRCFCPPSGLKAEAGCTYKACVNITHPAFVRHSSESVDDSSASSASSDE